MKKKLWKLFFMAMLLVLFPALVGATNGSTEYRGLALVADRFDLVSEQSIDQLLGLCIRYRIDTLYVPAVEFLEALYSSDLLPRSQVLLNNATPLEFDPLAYILQKGKTFGILVVPTVDFFTVWPSEDTPVNPRHVSNTKPSWMSRDGMGQLLTSPMVLDPGVAEVQAFCISLFKEVLTRYTPSALALKNFAYPSPQYGFNPLAMKSFESWKRQNFASVTNFDDFRSWVLDDLVARFSQMRAGLGVQTSLVLFHSSDFPAASTSHFQNWLSWVNGNKVQLLVSWYAYADLATVNHDTRFQLESVAGSRFWPALRPLELVPSQFRLIAAKVHEFPVSGLVVDTKDAATLEFLNAIGFGIPR